MCGWTWYMKSHESFVYMNKSTTLFLNLTGSISGNEESYRQVQLQVDWTLKNIQLTYSSHDIYNLQWRNPWSYHWKVVNSS